MRDMTQTYFEFEFSRVCFMFFSLQRILGVVSLNEVLDPCCINPQNIIHNMTKVNKHGVVALDDKTSKFITN